VICSFFCFFLSKELKNRFRGVPKAACFVFVVFMFPYIKCTQAAVRFRKKPK